MNAFVTTLMSEFETHGNQEIAQQQKKYMRNQFEFYGLKTPQRRLLQRPFFQKEFLPSKSEAFEIIQKLYTHPYRDLHHVAIELTLKYKSSFEKADLSFFEDLLLTHSWWDTVDVIAPKIMGTYFKKYPAEQHPTIQKWITSNNIWLQRSCIIFQLKYKKETNILLLEHVIQQLHHSKEFFIQKAIGWMLRDISKWNPDYVWNYAHTHPLSPLSYKEAIRNIK